MKDFWHDLLHGLRLLKKSPGFALLVILTLGLGVGGNTAISSVAHGVFLRPLPYPQSDRIIRLSISYNGQLDHSGFAAREFDFWKAHSEPLEYVAAMTPAGFNLSARDLPLRVQALRVFQGYFHVMGVLPALGREFSPDEDCLKGPKVASPQGELQAQIPWSR